MTNNKGGSMPTIRPISSCEVGESIKLGDEIWERVVSVDEWDDPHKYMRVQWSDHKVCSTFRRLL